MFVVVLAGFMMQGSAAFVVRAGATQPNLLRFHSVSMQQVSYVLPGDDCGVLRRPSTAILPWETRGATALAHPGRMYRSVSETHYLATAFVQGGLLRVLANYIAQAMLVMRGLQSGVVVSTLLTMLCLGATISGACNAGWTRFLDARIGSSRGGVDVALKALIDFSCWAPICNSCYLFFCPLVGGVGVMAAWENLCERFLAVMALELACFTPYHILAFSSIPPAVRPLCHSGVAAIFTIGLSLSC